MLDVHSQYQLFPDLTPDEYQVLKDSIRERGVLVPVEVDDMGTVLDGHHRLRAWAELRGEGCDVPDYPRVIRKFASEAEKRNHVRTLNIVRRHLSRDQRDKIVADMLRDGMSTREAAQLAGVSNFTAHRAGVRFLTPDERPKSVIGADGKQYPATRPPAAPQVSIFATTDAQEHKAWADARTLDSTPEMLTATQARMQVAKEKQPSEVITPPLPPDCYRCIVIDPPWPIVKIEREERPNQGEALDYPTMTLEQIAALPVAQLAHQDGCHIYLWVTQKYLPVGQALLETWGAKYQCLMTWVKPTGMTPYSWMYNTEHVLFARIGNLRLDRFGLKLSFDAPVIRHSQKPDVFYERVVMASPGPRLEMFARQERDGFTAWGNEVVK